LRPGLSPRNSTAPQAAVQEIGKVAEGLAGLAADLESEFNDELVRQGLPARLSSGEKGRASRAGPRRDQSIAS
jgi:hypothetical protein